MYVPILVILGRSRRMASFGRFSNVENFRPEADSDVKSGVVVNPTGMKICIQFDDSKSNRCRDIRLPHFVTNDNDNDAAGRRTPRRICLETNQYLWQQFNILAGH